MKNQNYRRLKILGTLVSVCVSVCFVFPTFLLADDVYPNKVIRLIIPQAPGGSTDIVGRLIATKLAERLGKPVIADNRSGAGGVMGTEVAARSAPDGYTLLLIPAGHAINPALYKLRYDHENAFVPIAKVASGPNVLTVNPNVPVNSVKELIALAKKQPGKLICSASGVGSFMHLGTELFKMMAGIDVLIVQFKGGNPAMTDTMGGHSQIALGTLTMSLPQIKSGRLKLLGIGGATRSKLLPDVPTISEAGLPGYEATNWWGVIAPAGTPKAIVDKLQKELAVIVTAEDVKKMFGSQGANPDFLGSAEFGKFITAETTKWGKVVKEANIKVE